MNQSVIAGTTVYLGGYPRMYNFTDEVIVEITNRSKGIVEGSFAGTVLKETNEGIRYKEVPIEGNFRVKELTSFLP